MDDIKLCIQKILPDDIPKLKEINKLKGANYKNLKAAFYNSKRWPPGSTIKIKFLEIPPENIERKTMLYYNNNYDEDGVKIPFDPIQQTIENMDPISAIKLIIKERFEPYINLKFIFVQPSEDANIRIGFKPKVSWSLVGTDCFYMQTGPDIPKILQKQVTLNFGWFDVGTVMHEFGHALGMIHEHQNPNENPIRWDLQAVYNWALRTQGWDQITANSQIIVPYNSDMINGSNFDPESIMLYFFPASITSTVPKKGTRQNLRLSIRDVLYLNNEYKDPESNIQQCGITNCLTPQQFYFQTYNIDYLNVTLGPNDSYFTPPPETPVPNNLQNIINNLKDIVIQNFTVILITVSIMIFILILKFFGVI
jgi:hypothetical protein